jgi:predicted aspartyl protease
MLLKAKLKPLGECKMGLTHVAVRLFNSASSDTYEADFLVDTGATDTMAPASDLKRIGIQPLGKDVYELANGELVEYEYGNAELRFMNEIVPIRIVFGPDGSEPILGVIALEAAGFIVDPKNRMLRKLRARSLKRVA